MNNKEQSFENRPDYDGDSAFFVEAALQDDCEKYENNKIVPLRFNEWQPIPNMVA